jgi:Uma2 family endonuclease
MAMRIPEYVSPEEYLERERAATEKSEYLHGVIYAMAGGSPNHSAIAANAITEFTIPLRGGRCRVFTSDLKVRSSAYGIFAYPDISIVCGELQFHDSHRDVITNPTVIVEVLSPSTAGFDRGRKRMEYQRIPSLKDYILIEQDDPVVEHFERKSANSWLVTVIEGLDKEFYIASLDCTLKLSLIYSGVDFPKSVNSSGEELPSASPSS